MAVLTGTLGNDTRTGTNSADDISGLAGNDNLYGNGGDDILRPGAGTDYVNGGNGTDTVVLDKGLGEYNFARISSTRITATDKANGEIDTLDNVERVQSGNKVLEKVGSRWKPVALDDVVTIGEDSAGSTGSVLANNGSGADFDIDGASLTVSMVNGVTTKVGQPITLAGGGTVVINANGTFSFSTNGAYESLAAGQQQVETVTYRITDSHGHTSIGKLDITILGADEAQPLNLQTSASVLVAGPEVQLNQFTAGHQLSAASSADSLAVLADGSMVATWYSYNQGETYGSNIFARHLAADGTPLGNEFLVNTTTTEHQYEPVITTLAGGNFLITWGTFGQTGSGHSLFGQMYDSSMAKVGAEFQIDPPGGYDAIYSDNAALTGGGFVVGWLEHPTFITKVQMFDAQGQKLGSEISINSPTGKFYTSPQVEALANGGFIVTNTMGDNNDSSSYHVVGQIFDATGTPQGGAFQIDTGPLASAQADVQTLANGGFVVSWLSYDEQTGLYDLDAQIFDGNGLPVGSNLGIVQGDTMAGDMVTVTELSNGDMLFAWTTHDGAVDTYDVVAQRVDANGTAIGERFQIHDGGAGYQFYPHIVADQAGGFTAMWSGNGTDADYGVYVRHFAPGSETAGNDVMLGSNAAETIVGADGNDILDGAGGDDLLVGDNGVDRLAGGEGADTFYIRGTGIDTITDFDAQAGDVIDLSAVLGSHPQNAITQYIHLIESNGSTTLEVDAARNGQFATVAVLEGATGLDLQQLVGSGNLVTS